MISFRNADRCLDFGRELLRTADLDPLYVLLYTAKLPKDTLARYLVAYSLFYHAGAAAACAEAYINPTFWQTVLLGIDQFPRGTERRHWRGQLALKTYEQLSCNSPEYLAAMWTVGNQFQHVYTAVQRWVGYGPWIAFKMADMMDRTGFFQVINWAPAQAAIYDDPKKGAALYLYDDQEHRITTEETTMVLNDIAEQLSGHRAPPIYDRPINVQEAETILCKYKSHVNGHYPVGKDTREILHALQGWGPLAERLASCPLF